MLSGCKVGSADVVDTLIRQALPGLELAHVPQPPAAVPVKLDFVYFALKRSGRRVGRGGAREKPRGLRAGGAARGALRARGRPRLTAASGSAGYGLTGGAGTLGTAGAFTAGTFRRRWQRPARLCGGWRGTKHEVQHECDREHEHDVERDDQPERHGTFRRRRQGRWCGRRLRGRRCRRRRLPDQHRVVARCGCPPAVSGERRGGHARRAAGARRAAARENGRRNYGRQRCVARLPHQ